ncbi:hypothetical protein GN244_ATG14608 [Phytophthora infestans]|uniref:Uncharacterized protein n=1 Tax=Phytophthora infestans TaxID=4787 RepID=A0A833SJW0_PHYIN|nr:hypothetical protein GN244_ATG14608 [Phytophthora infestans]
MDNDFDDNVWPFEDEGEPDDVLTTVGDGSIEVSKLLAHADNEAGAYSFGGLAETLPIAPGLFVEGLGFAATRYARIKLTS